MQSRVIPAQIIATLLLLALASPFAIDLVHAIGAQPCPAGGPGCYPWGAEGPVAGVWSYASKTNYLLRGFGQLAILLVTGLYLIWRGPGRAFSRASRIGIAVAVAAFVALLIV